MASSRVLSIVTFTMVAYMNIVEINAPTSTPANIPKKPAVKSPEDIAAINEPPLIAIPMIPPRIPQTILHSHMMKPFLIA